MLANAQTSGSEAKHRTVVCNARLICNARSIHHIRPDPCAEDVAATAVSKALAPTRLPRLSKQISGTKGSQQLRSPPLRLLAQAARRHTCILNNTAAKDQLSAQG